MTELFNTLYTRFLEGRAGVKDLRELKSSLNNLSDEELSTEMKHYWEAHDTYPKMNASQKQTILENIHHQLFTDTNRRTVSWRRMAAAVAVVVLLVVTGWNIAVLQRPETPTTFFAEVPAGNKVQLTLPDKSTVKLNSESTLSYSYQAGKRMVKLDGEAFFNVSKDKNHPFVVQVGSLNIEVLGTSFNVCSYSEYEVIEASLLTGTICLYDTDNHAATLILKPSQKAVYSKSDRTIRFLNTDNVQEIAWVKNNLVFSSEKLSTVFGKIERWYGVKIRLLCPEIANDRISGSFRNEQLPYVMEALRIQYGFRYEINGNEVIINKSNLK